MKKRSILRPVVALLMAVLLCMSLAACDLEQMAGLLEQFAMPGNDTEYLEEGDSIYSLSIFDELPSKPSDIDPMFWVAEGKKGGKVYFLGSIHCAERETYRLPDKLMDAFLESDSLAVECDILAFESDFMAQLSMTNDLMYMDGSSVKDHLDPELYDAMVEFVEENPSSSLSSMGYTTDMLSRCKPAMWLSVLETIVCEKAGLQSDLGIDYHFLNIATSQKKPIIEIESVEFQNDMLTNFPDELMELQLWSYVSTPVEEQADALYEMFEGWTRGDATALISDPAEFTDCTEEEIELYEGLISDYNDAMCTDRNLGMVEAAVEMLENGDNVFYVVGAAHMVGNDGIIALLRDKGYTVTQLGGEDADPYTTVDCDIHAATWLSKPEDNTTTTTTASQTTTTTVPEDFDDGGYDYDLYVEMYEYFGGTTVPSTKPTGTGGRSLFD